MMFSEYCNLRSKTSKLYSRIQAVFLRFLRKLYVSTKFLHQESMWNYGYYAVWFSIPEQTAQTFLSNVVALEFRYSFSQAEVILSDNIPENARITFLAFKGTIKKIVNYVSDRSGKFHEIPSYVLKTILFNQVETKENSYWKQTNVLEIFFSDLLLKLTKCIETRACPMYWNPSINLLDDMSEEDAIFINERLHIISADIVNAIADDWLELERCVRLNCCGCCVIPHTVRNVVEPDIKRHHVITIPCCYAGSKCCGEMKFDEDLLYVY